MDPTARDVLIFWFFVIVPLGFALALARSGKEIVTPNDEKGSASYAESLPQQGIRPKILLGYKQGVFSGGGQSPDDLLTYAGENHLLTVGATRSGKGAGAIIPNLLEYEGSVLVVDPKGENVRETASARQAKGHKIFVIDPWQITDWPSDCYNPLLECAEAGNTTIEDARFIAEALVVRSSDVSQLFFEEEAKSVLSTLIAHMLTSDKRSETLSLLLDIMGKPDKDVGNFIRKLVNSTELDGFISRGASRFVDKTPNEYSGVLSTVRQHIAFLDSHAMKSALSSSKLRLALLRESRTTIYLVIPVWEIQTFSRWLRLIVTMALRELAQPSESQKSPVLIIVDEFASLGLLPSFDAAFALMAGLGYSSGQLYKTLISSRTYTETHGRRL